MPASGCLRMIRRQATAAVRGRRTAAIAADDDQLLVKVFVLVRSMLVSCST
jgi:hypothetical protein